MTLSVRTINCSLGTRCWRNIQSTRHIPDIFHCFHSAAISFRKSTQLCILFRRVTPLRIAKCHSSPRPKWRVLLPRQSSRLSGAVKVWRCARPSCLRQPLERNADASCFFFDSYFCGLDSPVWNLRRGVVLNVVPR